MYKCIKSQDLIIFNYIQYKLQARKYKKRTLFVVYVMFEGNIKRV